MIFLHIKSCFLHLLTELISQVSHFKGTSLASSPMFPYTLVTVLSLVPTRASRILFPAQTLGTPRPSLSGS